MEKPGTTACTCYAACLPDRMPLTQSPAFDEHVTEILSLGYENWCATAGAAHSGPAEQFGSCKLTVEVIKWNATPTYMLFEKHVLVCNMMKCRFAAGSVFGTA